jgi:hypothetical protein
MESNKGVDTSRELFEYSINKVKPNTKTPALGGIWEI